MTCRLECLEGHRKLQCINKGNFTLYVVKPVQWVQLYASNTECIFCTSGGVSKQELSMILPRVCSTSSCFRSAGVSAGAGHVVQGFLPSLKHLQGLA